MPAKRNSKINTNNENVNFVLKHRITGAGFLLLFGALILPWMLGSSGQTEKHDSIDNSSVEVISNIRKIDRASSLLNQGDSSPNLTKENIDQGKVYISKITPLNKDSLTSNTKANTSTDSINIPSEDSNEPNDKKINEQVERDDKKSSHSESSDSESSENTEELEAVAIIDVGWVVQVGVFTDKNGADRVVRDLQSKGFKPSTSIVDTNRGKATGSRIWLGPYAQRIDAAKAKSELTNKTGEAGFIRAYP